MTNVIIATDGGSRGNGDVNAVGGYGAILIYGEHRKEISEGFIGVTNNQMELLSVIKALKCLKFPCNVELYSDSKYVCDAINKNWLNSWASKGWVKSDRKEVANKELWQELLPLLEYHNVTFNWVKGHNGHPLNERCDELANIEMNKLQNGGL